MTHFNDDQLEKLTTLNLVLSCFSFLGSSFIIFMYLRVSELRSFVFRCIFYLSISDVFYSFANMLADPNEGTGLCYFQGIMISYFNLASVLWTTSVAFTLHHTMLKNNASYHKHGVEKMMKIYHCVCWGVPFVLGLLPLTTSSYGDAGAWCWLKSNDDADQTWRMLQFYVPLWLCVCYNGYVYVRVMQVIASFRDIAYEEDNRVEHEAHVEIEDLSVSAAEPSRVVETQRVASDEPKQGGGESSFTTLERVRYYPAVLIVCYFWATVNRIHDMASDNSPFWLSVLHTIGASSQGLLNSLVYGYSQPVREAFAELVFTSSVLAPCVAFFGINRRRSTTSQMHREQTQELHRGEKSGSNSGEPVGVVVGSSELRDVALNDD